MPSVSTASRIAQKYQKRVFNHTLNRTPKNPLLDNLKHILNPLFITSERQNSLKKQTSTIPANLHKNKNIHFCSADFIFYFLVVLSAADVGKISATNSTTVETYLKTH